MISGKGTVIHKPRLSNLHPNAVCGEDCRIHSHCWIGDHVKIGNRVKIQAYTFIPPGVTIGDDVFIGPRVTFTNDKKPPSHHIGWMETHVERFAVIGAGAVILPGLKIGQGALIGAGSVVTKDVAPYTIVVGNPARVIDTRTERR